MNKRVDCPESPEQQLAKSPKSVENAPLGASGVVRRNLFQKGAVVVGVTLASRPVLAWQCKTTSAWGSELLNPATSLNNNTAHPKVADEGWYVSDWANNTNNNGAMSSKGRPWNFLETSKPAIKKYFSPESSYSRSKVTVQMLANTLGVAVPITVSSSDFAKDVFAKGAANFGAATLAAQLNFVLLSPFNDPFNHEKCVNLDQLKAMAGLTFTPSVGGNKWTDIQVIDYLNKNYIVR